MMQAPRPDPSIRHSPTDARKCVILVGSSVRAAAEAARAAGFCAVSVDLHGDQDTRRATIEHVSLETLAERFKAGASLRDLLPQWPAMIVGGLPRLCVQAVQRTESSGRSETLHDALIRNSYLRNTGSDRTDVVERPTRQANQATVLALRNPTYLDQFLDPDAKRRAKICVPKSFDLKGGIPDFLSAESRWLIKPAIGSGGVGIRSYETQPIECDGILQQQIHGRKFGVVYLSRLTEYGPESAPHIRRVGVSRSLTKRVGPFPFVYAGSAGPVDMDLMQSETCTPAIQDLDRFVERIAYQNRLAGLINVDVVVDAWGTIWVLEVNPRWSASCEVLASGGGLFQSHFDATFGLATKQHERPYQQNAHVMSKRVVFSDRSGRFDGALLSALPCLIVPRDLPIKGTVVASGDPILTLTGPWDSLRRPRDLIALVRDTVG